MRLHLLLLSILSLFSFAWAEPTPPTDDVETPQMTAEHQRLVEIFKSLKYREGAIDLPGGMAKLNLPPGYRFLDKGDATKVLVDLWGNPPQGKESILGMILPAGSDLGSPNGWAIAAEFEENGYVSDKDADDIDYSDLLSKMKASNQDNNERRKKEGFPTLTLVDWALPPHYDKQHRVLYWAKHFLGENGENALNYDVRVLGRRGVLSLVAISNMNQLEEVQAATPEIVAMVDFKEGHRYADFNPKTDTVSKVGLAGLIAGGTFVAAKAGLFKGIWLAILAGKKFVVMGCVAVAGFFKKMFGKKQEG